MKKYHCQNLIFPCLLVAGVFVASAFLLSAQAADIDASAEQLEGAFKDLSVAVGQTVTTHEQAAQLCDSEKYFEICAKVGKEHNLYKPEEIKQVNGFLNEIKGKVAEQLKNCQTTECLINVADELAKKVSAKDSTLAAQFDLTPKIVEKKQAVISAAKELGVNFDQCRQMDPDTAPVELLRSCAKLAKDSRIKNVIPEAIREQAENYVDYADKTTELRASLQKGEFQCGSNTLESCGDFCLNPAESAKIQGTSAIPPVCRQIAKRFFGPEGEKQLESAYGQVQRAQNFYLKKAQNTVFTTLDGRTITNLEDIGRYMEEQGKQGNVEAVKKGLDFMVAQGFVKPEEKEFALQFVKHAKQTGGQLDFDHCSQDPASCRDFIPAEHRGELEAGLKVQQLFQQQLGFDPRQCENAAGNPELAQKCFEASKKILPQLESLSGQNVQFRQFVGDLKQNVNRADQFNSHRDELQQTFQQQGGPGGCKSEQECSQYCSDPAHGPECIAFGTKSGIFRGQEAVQKFQQFNQGIQQSNQIQQGQQPEGFNFPGQGFGAQGGFPGQGFGFPGQGFGQQGGFPGQGPFPGFQPPGQGGFPPGQIPGFPGSQNQGGFGQTGPSPECFATIQSGDFVRAKTVCTVSLPTFVPGPSFTPLGPPVTVPPGESYQPYPTYSYNPVPCPSGSYFDPTLKQCQPEANYQQNCVAHGGVWDTTGNYCRFPQPSYSSFPSPGGSYSPAPSCTPGTYWDEYSHVCKPAGSYSPYPSPSGSYSPYPSPGGSYSPYPSPTNVSGSCPSGAHIMYVNNAPGYCMSDANTSLCGPLNSTSVSSFTSSYCSSYGTYSPAPSGSYTPYPSSGGSWTPPPSCPSGQWWDYIKNVCTSTISSYSPAPSGSFTPYPSPGTCPIGQYWYWPPSGAGYCKINETPYPSSSTSYTPISACPTGSYWDTVTFSCKSSTSSPSPSSGITYTPYPSYSYSPYPSSGTSYSPYPTYTYSTTYSPAPTYSTTTTYSPPPSCPSGQFWDTVSHTCKVAANFVQQQIALANTIMACADSGGRWDAGKRVCRSASFTQSFFGNISKIFSRFVR